MIFSEALKHMRKELNLSQEALAHEIMVSFATINKWENNKSKPIRIARERLLEFGKSKGVSKEIIKTFESELNR